jgi:hypothetical protein
MSVFALILGLLLIAAALGAYYFLHARAAA